MSVRTDRIEEIVTVMRRHVDHDTALRMLCGLSRTEAYKNDTSFRTTIDRILKQLSLTEIPAKKGAVR